MPQKKIKIIPVYGTDFQYTYKTELERRKSNEAKKARSERNAKLKKCCFWLFIALLILIILVVIAGVVIYFFVCNDFMKNCPTGCYNCKFTGGDWVRYYGSSSFSASKRHCGDEFRVLTTDDSFKVDYKTNLLSSTTVKMTTLAPRVARHFEMEEDPNDDSKEVEVDKIQMFWHMDKTERMQDETLTLVFSDDGDQFAGCGSLDQQFFTNKNDGIVHSYTLLSSTDQPFYMPYYLTRNKQGSICMFADVQGKPLDITVSSDEVSWKFYLTHTELDISLYYSSGKTSHEALSGCIAMWRRLYPSPPVSWTNDFILGSFTTDQISEAKSTTGILATHYILSPDSFKLKESGIEVVNENQVSDYSNVFLFWEARQQFQSDSNSDWTPEKGFYKTDEEDHYILDFENMEVEDLVESSLDGWVYPGVILTGGQLYNDSNPPNDAREDPACPEFLECSLDQLDYDRDSGACLGSQFGEELMFLGLNNYDSARREVLGRGEKMVVESVASPGTSHFYRADLPLTVDGLKECFYSIVSLQAVGVRAVTCNMCGGKIPTETDPLESILCDRWSQLAMLMPYIIMSNSEVPPFIGDTIDAGRYVKNNLQVREQFGYYLDEAMRKAGEEDTPFVYPVTARHSDQDPNDVMKDNFQTTLMIGDKLMFIGVLEEPTGSLKSVMAPGEWFSNGGPLLAEHFTSLDGNAHEFAQDSTDMRNLIFFKAANIYVIKDADNEDHVIVKIFMPDQDHETPFSYDFRFFNSNDEEFTATIKMDTPNNLVEFISSGSAPSPDILVSKIEVYHWQRTRSSTWVAYNDRGNDRFNVVMDYVTKGDALVSIFSTWKVDIMNPDD